MHRVLLYRARARLERVRTVRAHHEKKLKQKFVSIREIARVSDCEMPVAVLPADLAKLAGPIGKYAGKAGVRQIGIGGVAAAVEASANSPAAVHPIFRG